MGKEMEKEKDMIQMENYNLTENIWIIKNGMEKNI